jgi:hypothetical protein
MPGLFDGGNPNPMTAGQALMRPVGRGSLISFSYPQSWATHRNIIHDPTPVVLITDIWPKYLRGVNIHYLTFPYVKKLLQGNIGNPNYSYYQVKPDRYIAEAFRMYNRAGITQLKQVDSDFILKLLNIARSWNPAEIEAMKQQIRIQIQQRLQMKADQMTTVNPNPALNQGPVANPGPAMNQPMNPQGPSGY